MAKVGSLAQPCLLQISGMDSPIRYISFFFCLSKNFFQCLQKNTCCLNTTICVEWMRFAETFPFPDMALPKFGVCQSKDSGTQNLGPLPFGKRMAASAHIPVWGSSSLAIKVRFFFLFFDWHWAYLRSWHSNCPWQTGNSVKAKWKNPVAWCH